MALTAMALDYGNASITYEQQPQASGTWRAAYLDRIFSSSLLPEAGVRKRLADLKDLSSNWDGEGAESLSDLTLRNAQKIALLVAKQTCFPDITPNPGDTLAFEWETESGSALMEVGHSTYSFLMKTKSGKRSTHTGNLDDKDDIAALGSLIQRTLF